MLRNMTPAGRDLASKIDEALAKGDNAAVIARYTVGKWIADAIEDEERFTKYYVMQQAAVLGVNKSQLLDWVKFSQTFELSFVEAETAKPLDDGKSRLTTWHWTALTRLTSKKDRAYWLRQTREQSLSAGKLMLAIQTAGSEIHGARQGGRKPQVSSSIPGGFIQLTKLAQKFENFLDAAQGPIFEGLEGLEEDAITGELVQIARSARDAMSSTLERANQAAQQLEEALEQLDAVLEARGEEVEEQLEPANGEVEAEAEEEAAPPRKTRTKAKKAKKAKKDRRPAAV